ncbi:MAG TPA: response regulator [Tepidisphaeraceae bacterium]|jgi:signal transduction histidine kinase/DNA-binding response OmpR family regulator
MSDGKVNILIVDDKPEKVLAIEAVLEELGQNVVRAYSGREGLRCLLNGEFAVILLDVNMPGMDGFETAALIRRRQASQHIPIIFITAFGDEMHIQQGYSLGAVDYILAPVVPEVLRSKVAVFVDLFKKTNQVQRQAEILRRRATQLQQLTAASVAINAALSIDKMLKLVTDTAREVVGSHQAITLFILDPGSEFRPPRTQAVASFSEKYADWREKPLALDPIAKTIVATSHTATRMTEAELHEHPDWEIVRKLKIPPIASGMLAVPLTGRGGNNLGVIYLADRMEGQFSSDDESILVQLAQMASIAIENAIFAEEREANRIKDEFLSTLSHELRTPLNAILGWTQLLRLEEIPEEASHGVDVIERNARAQAKLIEDLLDVSRINTGKLRLNCKPLKFAQVIEAAVESCRPAAEEKGVALNWSAPEIEGSTTGDPDRLQQVVWNLLSNAVKFTPAGGRVEMRLDSVNTHLRLQVTDTGQGIAPGFLPFVFDRFRQADSTSRRSHGGLGIGLAIVRRIVELHGGTVTAESPGEGRGSTFTVTLPPGVAALASPPPQALEAQGAMTSSARSDGEQDLSGFRILLVDDEPDARDVIARTLERCGAHMVTASSVVEALHALHSEKPEMIISDIAMPDQDGFDLLRQVRNVTGTSGHPLPVVALTAYASDEDRARALAAGFKAHLSKPIYPSELIEVVSRLCEERRALTTRNALQASA